MQAKQGTWYWGVHFSRRGQLHHKRFYFPKYGGSAKARAAAIAWRDEQLAKISALTMVQFCQQVRDNNTSGVPGVHFLASPRQPQGIWQAKLKLGGRAQCKSFSVRKYGFSAAYAMAVAARQNMLTEADDAPYLHDRVALRAARANTA
ncbi:MAG: AP2 domain-containing protein [Gammaproteobacteria bacterium]|nr:AP2 domain-containing protein [Gammaproteobacteria bacterium]